MNVLFLTSGHDPMDDRIFYHMARSLHNNNHKVQIISSKLDQTEDIDGISLNCFAGDRYSKKNKILHFVNRMSLFKPGMIICSEPLAVLSARKYSKKQPEKVRIIYDITEWYPSKKNLSVHNYMFRWFFFLKLLLFNIWVTRFVDSFIFGEWYKSRPYRLIFPRKPFIYVPYFPDPVFMPVSRPVLEKDKLRLSYSGRISMEKGYGNFFKVLDKISELRADLKIEVIIIGWYENDKDRNECESLFSYKSPNISITRYTRQDFKSFIDLIKDTDIFLDLRSDDFENQHCLPIKLFYYAHLGRPVIFSDLKAIRKEVDIEKFGFLADPEDSDHVVKKISGYLQNATMYYKHCRNARGLALNDYNWKKIEYLFLNFISAG
jgi:glycosyltransferase involved in cell wall biosynthesis